MRAAAPFRRTGLWLCLWATVIARLWAQLSCRGCRPGHRSPSGHAPHLQRQGRRQSRPPPSHLPRTGCCCASRAAACAGYCAAAAALGNSCANGTDTFGRPMRLCCGTSGEQCRRCKQETSIAGEGTTSAPASAFEAGEVLECAALLAEAMRLATQQHLVLRAVELAHPVPLVIFLLA